MFPCCFQVTKPWHPSWKNFICRWICSLSTPLIINHEYTTVSMWSTLKGYRWHDYRYIVETQEIKSCVHRQLHYWWIHSPASLWALQTLSLLLVQPLSVQTITGPQPVWRLFVVHTHSIRSTHALCFIIYLNSSFPSETRSCRLGCRLFWGLPGRPEHPLHPPALPVHADVWGSHQRKHSS